MHLYNQLYGSTLGVELTVFEIENAYTLHIKDNYSLRCVYYSDARFR